MASRMEAVDEVPEAESTVSISWIEARPISDGEGWCGADGAWFSAMWRAVARPFNTH